MHIQDWFGSRLGDRVAVTTTYGDTIEGIVLGASGSGVSLEVDGGKGTFEVAYVGIAVHREAPVPAAAPEAPPAPPPADPPKPDTPAPA